MVKSKSPESETDVEDIEDFDALTIHPCPPNMVALDCEMVGVGSLKRNALARCSIVDYHGNVIYDQHIKPHDKITDYRTKWSGILPSHMRKAVPFKVARKQIMKILANKIIVGHSLHFDFKILKYRRQAADVRDTSKCVLLRSKASLPTNQTPSLMKLSRLVLGRDIQVGTHCSVEDSIAAMDLYRTVEECWEAELSSRGRGNTTSSSSPSHNFLSDSFWPSWLVT